MSNYDFQILQHNEFEHLTRDLLQKKEGVFVESFTPGTDSGIDLRFAKVRGDVAIVQAKRYKDYALLKRVLQKEVDKVKQLDPNRYIISTSVGLTPQNKAEIQTMFSPYIRSTEDILGKDDLNNLLGLYPEIEKQYYKLWLGSTAVLEDILNKRINNWSSIEMEAIQREVSTYVMNSSFNNALDILTTNRYVVISGIPGIGKTTLARMLAYYLLSQGYEEFVKLETIGDAAQKLTAGKKQVFFFDDFLGSTFFQNDEKGFDQKIVAFIDKVKHEPDKIFILSTREYILAEAKQTFEVFTTNNIELAKCVLDLSDYTESIRAEILYNHLAVAELPMEYVRALLSDRSYLQIIKHNNFNPRIIETFLNKKLYQNISSNRFVYKFVEFFDRPFAVWELAYRQLKPVAQYALLVRSSMGDRPVLLSDWYLATKQFIKGAESEIHLTLNELIWNDTMKILEGTFVLTKRRDGEYLVGYQNPSVYDFLMEWLKELHDIQEYIIRESFFPEQLYMAFSNTENPVFINYGRIKLQESVMPTLKTAFKRHLTNNNYCTLKHFGFSSERKPQGIVDYLLDFERSYRDVYKQNPDLIEGVVEQKLFENKETPLVKRLHLLEVLAMETRQKLNLEQLSKLVADEAMSLDDFTTAMNLLSVTEAGKDVLESDEFLEKVEKTFERELENADSDEDCDRISDCLSMLSDSISTLNESVWRHAIDEVKNNIPQEPDYDEDFSRDFSSSYKESKDEYEEMFTSLLESAVN